MFNHTQTSLMTLLRFSLNSDRASDSVRINLICGLSEFEEPERVIRSYNN